MLIPFRGENAQLQIRVFESLDEVQRLRMEHVNRIFQEAAMKAWAKSRFIEVPPQEYVAEEDQLMVKVC